MDILLLKKEGEKELKKENGDQVREKNLLKNTGVLHQ